jgi:pyruvate/2-oxoglutarate dehydrogenase complex dihydrolipoamide dehydrogenase (E3) component
LTFSLNLIIGTYTHPEIAHVGKYESELDKMGVQYESFKRDLAPVDRCLCDGVSQGFVKITVKAGTDQIIGATICAPDAGSMISELTVCMQYGIGLARIAGVIHPYPTTQEAIRQCALQYYKYFKNPSSLPLTVLRLRMNEVEQNEKEL